jgi:hypothetical protein
MATWYSPKNIILNVAIAVKTTASTAPGITANPGNREKFLSNLRYSNGLPAYISEH